MIGGGDRGQKCANLSPHMVQLLQQQLMSRIQHAAKRPLYAYTFPSQLHATYRSTRAVVLTAIFLGNLGQPIVQLSFFSLILCHMHHTLHVLHNIFLSTS